jgi:hypothetical protein
LIEMRYDVAVTVLVTRRRGAEVAAKQGMNNTISTGAAIGGGLVADPAGGGHIWSTGLGTMAANGFSASVEEGYS